MVTQCLDKVTSQQEALTCVYGESLVLGLDLDPRDLGVRAPPPVLLWASEVLDVVWSRDSWRPLYSVSLKKQNNRPQRNENQDNCAVPRFCTRLQLLQWQEFAVCWGWRGGGCLGGGGLEVLQVVLGVGCGGVGGNGVVEW